MRLYHSPLSSSARRAVMASIELGVPVELVSVDLAKGEQYAPTHLAMNPNGKVPVLEDDGFFLWESHAIMTYLAEKTPGQTLYPSDLKARAEVSRWLFWSAHHFAPSISILNFEHFVKRLRGMGPADPARVAAGEAQLSEHTKVLDAHLANKTWVANDTLSLADLALAAPLMTMETAALPVKHLEHLMRWFDRVQATDAWKKTSL